MTKTNIFLFLTFFLQFRGENPALAQVLQKENRGSALYSDTIEAVHYSIYLTDVNLTDKSIKGYTEAKLVSRISTLTCIKLDLASLTVDSVFVDNIKTSAFKHTSTRLIVQLTKPLQAGQSLIVNVYYHGHPFVDPSGWGGFHFKGDYALNLGVGFDAIPHNLGKAWFACIDDFHDRALYDVYLTTTNDKKAISGGRLVDVETKSNNTSTWHWKTEFTLPTYLISATIGKYELRTDNFEGEHGLIPITYYSRPADTARTAGTFIHMKQILKEYENYFGPYPFERVGYAGSPGGLGAMEHASNITYPFSGWTGSTDKEWWYAHELSHMWFGDKVTCSSAEDMWLNEGWAVFCESLYREGIYGKQAYRDNMRSKLKDVLQTTHTTDGGYYAVYGIPQTITYGSTVYQKGGQVAHTLRGYLGDSIFFDGIKAYLSKYAYNYASTYDLRDFLSEYSGIDLKPFFDAWVFTPGFPHFSIDSVLTKKSSSGYDVTVIVRQRLKGKTQYADANHLEITFMDSNWHKVTDTIQFSGKGGRKVFHLPFAPVAAMADMDEKISDATTDMAQILTKPGEYDFPQTFVRVGVSQISDSALVRITHNWVAPDSENLIPKKCRISDSHYWTVEGIFSSGFKASGKFSYEKTSGLDKSLLSSPNDSLVILYRPGAGHKWIFSDCKRDGSYANGTITVEVLQPGEYAFAVLSKQ